MDLIVAAAKAIDPATAALAEAVEGVDRVHGAEGNASAAQAPSGAHGPQEAPALARGGFVERVLGETTATAAAAPAQPPGTRIDNGVETAAVQTLARPQATSPEPLRNADVAPPLPQPAQSEFALPAAQLVPAALVGLQVVHAESWPLPGHAPGTDRRPRHELRPDDRRPQETAPQVERAPERHDDEAGGEPASESERDRDPACGTVFADTDGNAWCTALTRVLRVALAARVPPHALLVAAGQWQRGRCVVLACPQGTDPAGAAWAFVLWPRRHPPARRDVARAPLELHGLRVEARLQWSALPHGATWCHVRVIKEHHPRSGRQLVAAPPAEPSGRVACEVQLGPVLARPLRCCDVCVRIHAAQRFWAALGAQWSMHVVVCSRPLLVDGPVEESSC